MAEDRMRLLNLMLDLEDEEIEDKLHMLQGAVLLLEELEPRPRRWWVRPWMLSPQKSRVCHHYAVPGLGRDVHIHALFLESG